MRAGSKTNLIILAVLLHLSTPATARPIVELSPTNIALKIIDLRLETDLNNFVAIAGQYRGGKFKGERNNYQNSEQTFRIGALIYPLANQTHRPFIGASLSHSTERIGRQSRRPRVSYFFPKDGGDQDSWTNEVTTLAIAPEVGYRLRVSKLVTTSVRWAYRLPLDSEVTTIDSNVIAPEINTEASESSPDQHALSLHVGITIP